MARSSSAVLAVAVLVAVAFVTAPSFVAPPLARAGDLDFRAAALGAAGLAPLAVEQPAMAYDSVVAMLQSWLVGGTVLTVIFAAAIIAAAANPLTKRRQEVQNMMKK
eukprot:CAMPEP_0183424972 /NCGR_PEP_ID=MMETSP0370-20130417/33827_1 /TAXON_ID=268820 /ORGANISM="Peridinium aciculiferum, Strain PAER-2" /LENGTH=106 /DNA_ID=CAMNT_0025609235 /DNA_START=70 /DNA_END=390 /DNA_ORIENTATION=+